MKLNVRCVFIDECGAKDLLSIITQYTIWVGDLIAELCDSLWDHVSCWKNFSRRLFIIVFLIVPLSIAPVFGSETRNIALQSSGTIIYNSPTPTPTPPLIPVSNGEMYIVFEGTLLSNGQPNAVAQRIVAAKNTYGLPTWVEVTTAYPWGEINNALVDYFHSAGIKVSFRVWSHINQDFNQLKPLATIKNEISQAISWASHVDLVMIDECNGDMLSYLADLSSYVHGLGKQIMFNMAGWPFSEDHIVLADFISVEHCWRNFIVDHNDWIVKYPNKFMGVSYDLGYDYLGQPDITVDLDRAIYDTKEAWNSGIHYYYAIGGTEGGGAFVLPSWYEAYLQRVK